MLKDQTLSYLRWLQIVIIFLFQILALNSINKLIKPHKNMKKINIIFLPRESEELYPTFNVDGKTFIYASYDK